MKQDMPVDYSIIIGIILFFVFAAVIVVWGYKKDSPATPADTSNDLSYTYTMPDGLQITTTKEGTGEATKEGDFVAVNYTGRLSDGTVFDSNVDPAFGHVQPFTLQLGKHSVIKGWEEGLTGVKVGQSLTLVIPPELGYGSRSNGKIPANATLTFDIDVLSIHPNTTK